MDSGSDTRRQSTGEAAFRRPVSPEACRTVDTGAGGSGARILVVDDQDDVRGMLGLTLRLEGHQVTEAPNASEGLERLRLGRYDLVLSDYAMPGATGSWMLNQATALGLLDHTAAVLITAHPQVEPVPGVVVLTKPLDLDVFIEQLRELMDSRPDSPAPLADSAVLPRVELTLYVRSISEASRQARAAVEEVLASFDASQVRYTVHDLIEEPLAGADDRITFTPTLVRRHPSPREWLLGSLHDSQIVTDLLLACGVDRSRA
jgi:CheY-like chemotaxis protein